MTENIKLLDPTAEKEPAVRKRAQRPESLEKVVVGLVDISKPRGDVFLDEIERLLNQRGIRTRRYQKPAYTRPAPVDLRQKIASECGAVIQALAD